jgi:hypothetical protein
MVTLCERPILPGCRARVEVWAHRITARLNLGEAQVCLILELVDKWITKGIINSCKRKRDLYLLIKSKNDNNLRNYYLRYSKILSKVIKTAKKLHYNNKITHAHNKIKATWNVIKSDIGANNNKHNKRVTDKNCEAHSSKFNAENFNEYFLKLQKVFQWAHMVRHFQQGMMQARP